MCHYNTDITPTVDENILIRSFESLMLQAYCPSLSSCYERSLPRFILQLAVVART